MKRWIHSTKAVDATEEIKSAEQPKLKRTLESGHSYEGDLIFENGEEYLKWCKEDELYED